MLIGPAASQSLKPLTIVSASAEASAEPGGQAIFQLTIRNAGLLDVEAKLNATGLPPAWLYSVSPDPIVVPANSTNTTTLIVHVPDDATPGARIRFDLAAWEAGGFNQQASEPLPLNVTVAQPSAPPTSAIVAPRLDMAIGGSSAPAGGAADGMLTLYTDDVNQLDVHLSASSANGWIIQFPEGDFFRVYRDFPTNVKLVAHVPSNLATGTERAFTITAAADGFAYTTTWLVTVAPPAEPPAAGSSPTAGGSTGSATGSGGGTSPTNATSTSPTPAPTLGLEAAPPDDPVAVAPGAGGTGTITLRNTGTKTLHLTIRGDAADGWPVLVEPPIATLGPGVTLDVDFTVEAPRDITAGGTGSGTLTITGDDGLLRTIPFQLTIVEGARAFDTPPASTEGASAPQPAPVQVTTGATIAIAGAVAVVGATALAIANRPIREKLLWGAIGLYTRLARPDVLGHEERERLYRVVETQPGIHFHALQRDLSWNTGTLTYHLRVLERHGFVVSRRDGPYRRFYVQGAAPKKETFNPDAPHGLRADVLEAIRNHHGISQTDLALALGANKQTVNYHVKALERNGTIRVEKRGRETFLYPGGAPATGSGEVHA